MDVPDPDPGEIVLVIRFPAEATEQDIMDVMFAELARVLNNRLLSQDFME